MDSCAAGRAFQAMAEVPGAADRPRGIVAGQLARKHPLPWGRCSIPSIEYSGISELLSSSLPPRSGRPLMLHVKQGPTWVVPG